MKYKQEAGRKLSLKSREPRAADNEPRNTNRKHLPTGVKLLNYELSKLSERGVDIAREEIFHT
jgi:hypothetical protein